MVQLHRCHRQNLEKQEPPLILSEAVLSTTISNFQTSTILPSTPPATQLFRSKTQMVLQPVLTSPCPKSTMVSTLSFRPNSNSMVTIVSRNGWADTSNLVQPYQHHTNVPATGINVYSFGLKPEEHQPSGTCNMSRIDNATLQLTLTAATVSNNSDAKVRVYATNYNVLRIMSGMGGLAYSN